MKHTELSSKLSEKKRRENLAKHKRNKAKTGQHLKLVKKESKQ